MKGTGIVISTFCGVLLSAGLTLADEGPTPEQIQANALKRAKTLSLQIVKALESTKASGIQLTQRKIRRECSLVGSDEVSCEVTDFNKSEGYSEGIAVTWSLSTGKNYKNGFWLEFESASKMEH